MLECFKYSEIELSQLLIKCLISECFEFIGCAIVLYFCTNAFKLLYNKVPKNYYDDFFCDGPLMFINSIFIFISFMWAIIALKNMFEIIFTPKAFLIEYVLKLKF